MRVAAIYDIHGNLPALEAVLADVRRAKVDHIVVGGDVVPGPMPLETLARLHDVDVPMQFIQGNGEAAVLTEMKGGDSKVPEAFRDVLRWTARQFGPEQERLLASWPRTIRVAIPGLGDVLFCHATPRSDTEIFTRITPEERVAPAFAGVDASLVICGHTHMQFDRMVGAIRIVNAGSVGMPFGEPGADWLLLGPEVQLRHTTYDLDRAAERIRGTSYPQAPEFATRDVLKPRTEREMLDAFSA
jgi:predicted phosphodiesterase